MYSSSHTLNPKNPEAIRQLNSESRICEILFCGWQPRFFPISDAACYIVDFPETEFFHQIQNAPAATRGSAINEVGFVMIQPVKEIPKGFRIVI